MHTLVLSILPWPFLLRLSAQSSTLNGDPKLPGPRHCKVKIEAMTFLTFSRGTYVELPRTARSHKLYLENVTDVDLWRCMGVFKDEYPTRSVCMWRRPARSTAVYIPHLHQYLKLVKTSMNKRTLDSYVGASTSLTQERSLVPVTMDGAHTKGGENIIPSVVGGLVDNSAFWDELPFSNVFTVEVPQMVPLDPSRPTLPLEVCERVIDHVAHFPDSLGHPSDSFHDSHPRQSALCACARACKAWLTRCRYHLFRSSGLIENFQQLSGYVQMLRAHPELIDLVQSLQFARARPYKRLHWINVLPLQLAPMLSSLDSIAFISRFGSRYESDNITYHPRFHISLSMFRSVTELHYQVTHEQTFDELSRFVLSFPRLRTLHLKGEFSNEAQLTTMTHLGNKLGRKRLYLTYLHISTLRYLEGTLEVTKWVPTICYPQTLTTLEIWGLMWFEGPLSNARAAGELIQSCVNLQHLLLYIPSVYFSFATPHTQQELEADLVHFRDNLHLRTVELLFDSRDLLFAIKVVANLLSEAGSEEFREITLRFLTLGPPQKSQDICAPIVDILRHPKFDKLERVLTDLPSDAWSSPPHMKRFPVVGLGPEKAQDLYMTRHPILA